MNTIISLDKYKMESLISDLLMSVIKDSESYIKPFGFHVSGPRVL